MAHEQPLPPLDQRLAVCRHQAKEGLPNAQLILARLLRNNPHVADERGFEHWYEQAAGSGHPIAQFELAVHYARQSNPRALTLLRDAYCNGHPAAAKALTQLGAAAPTCNRDAIHDLDGTWEGTLPIVQRDNPKKNSGDPSVTIRLVINAGSATAHFQSKKGWAAVKPLSLQFRSHKANATLHSTTTAGTRTETGSRRRPSA